jgi:hypothetical protein
MFVYTREKIHQLLWDARHHLAIFPRESKNRILVVQEEGLGNAVLTTPLIQALATLEPKRSLDVLVARAKGTGLVFENWSLINKVWDRMEFDAKQESVLYNTVLDCHPRHELPRNIKYQNRLRICIHTQPGLDYHWNFSKHESEYLLDLARRMGFKGVRPGLRKLTGDPHYVFDFSNNMVAIGIGYYKGLRADGRDWSDRHWGNENFLELCGKLRTLGFRPILVGDQKDFEHNGAWLAQRGIESICGKLSLPQVVDFIGHCRAFIGNDTGLMHVAAAQGIAVIGIFVSTNSIKSYPMGSQAVALGGDQGRKYYKITVEQVFKTFGSMTEH